MFITSTILAPFALVGKGTLYLFGFSSAGPVSGTFAAGWQAMFGGVLAKVSAGGIFATAQSAAMGGATAVTSLIGAVATATTITGGWIAIKGTAYIPGLAAKAVTAGSWFAAKAAAALCLW